MESGHVIFDAHWDHELYSGRDGAPPPSAQRNGRTVNSVALRHRGRGRRRSAVPTLTGFMERPQVNFDARCSHERAGSEYLAPPEPVHNKHHRRGEVPRARFMGSHHANFDANWNHEPRKV